VIRHIVQQGECLSSIAAQYGFSDWRTIYDDAANAQLRATRPNPNVLYPDDELIIPDRQLRQENRPTDARHRFQVNAQPTFLNVRLQDPEKKPIANIAYTLEIDGIKREGSTDGDGWVKQKIPAQAQSGVLILRPDPKNPEAVVRWELKLGHLDPLETDSGVTGRLNNLGYRPRTDEHDEYVAAVRKFQEDNGLTVDGIVGGQTRDKLRQEHRV